MSVILTIIIIVVVVNTSDVVILAYDLFILFDYLECLKLGINTSDFQKIQKPQNTSTTRYALLLLPSHFSPPVLAVFGTYERILGVYLLARLVNV